MGTIGALLRQGFCGASRIPRPLTEVERFCGGQSGRRLAERRRTGQAPYPAPVDEHYFTPSPATDDRRHPPRVRLAGQDLDLVRSEERRVGKESRPKGPAGPEANERAKEPTRA